MKVTAIELRRISLPLVSPFRTSFSTQNVKDALLVRIISPDSEGWGECVALADPRYSAEYTDGAQAVIRDHLAPAILKTQELSAAQVATVLAPFKGHPMAKAAIEMGVLDAELRAAGMPLSVYLGAVGDRVPSGVSVGIMDSIPALLEAVGAYVDEGYARIKLKIEPGWDVEPVRAVRAQHPTVPLQVDANTAYTLADARHLARLDPFDLLLIEQPLPEDDLRGHAELARCVQTPICLDESVTSARSAADAIAIGACRVVNIKAGRVGGYLEARRVAAVCAANGVPVWCGGMVETGLGRAANVALAACPEFTMVGDVSGSDRFFARDITAPLQMRDGWMSVPTGPGLGVDVVPEVLQAVTTSTDLLQPGP
jgi:O-succinylbenzoate synthase